MASHEHVKSDDDAFSLQEISVSYNEAQQQAGYECGSPAIGPPERGRS
jgi:hypothetical protein